MSSMNQAVKLAYQINQEKIIKDLNNIRQLINCSGPKVYIQKRLYGYETIVHGMVFCETEAELISYIGHNWFAQVYIVDFIADFQGQKDVIRKASMNGITYQTAIDECKVLTYNLAESTHQQRPIWDEHIGYLKREYEAFYTTGIVLTKSIYEEIITKNKIKQLSLSN